MFLSTQTTSARFWFRFNLQRPSRSGRRAVLHSASRVAAAVVLLAGASVAHSQGEPCTLQQLTNTMNTPISTFSSVSVSQDGATIALTAEIDPLGTNADGNAEVYLVDTASGVFTQVTFSTGDIISPLGGVNNSALLSADGSTLFFSSFRDYAGSNADLGQELFSYRLTDGVFEQLTSNAGGTSHFIGGLSLSANSTLLSFGSSFNPMGLNPAGILEHWSLDLNSGVFVRLTSSSGGANSVAGAVDGAGLSRLFTSRHDFTGENPDNRFEAFVVTTDSLVVEQLSDSPAPFENAGDDISQDGTEALISSFDDLDGLNPENNREVFLFDRSTSLYSLITNSTTALSGRSRFSDDARWVLFASDADFVSPNPTGEPRLYRYERSTGLTSLVVDSPSFRVAFYDLDENASTIAFTHDRDLVGNNADESIELFVATCAVSSPPIVEVPTLSAVALSMFGVLLAGLAILRSRISAG